MDPSERFKSAYLFTDETILRRKWEGLYICQKFDDQYLLEDERFENDHIASQELKVHQDMELNEFFILLKNKFFAGNANLQEEDIWLYRILQPMVQDKNPR